MICWSSCGKNFTELTEGNILSEADCGGWTKNLTFPLLMEINTSHCAYTLLSGNKPMTMKMGYSDQTRKNIDIVYHSAAFLTSLDWTAFFKYGRMCGKSLNWSVPLAVVKKTTVTAAPSHFYLSSYFWNSLREQWAVPWWPDGQQSSEFLVLGSHDLMTFIMLWDRQNYFQAYEFDW